MAPLSNAINVNHTSSDGAGVKVYEGDIDAEWTIGAVPHGGYVLALIVKACMHFQSSTGQPDPIHVTAHYLRATSISHFEVHIRALKTGRGFSNIIADFIQNGGIRVTTHIIFGVLSPSPVDSGLDLTLAPPSRYARRLPLYTHPSNAVSDPIRSTWVFRRHFKWSQDPEILSKNKLDSPNRTGSTTIGGGGLEWGAWFEFNDKEERITTPSLAFLIDIFINLPTLLPKSERVGLTTSWYPTMTLTIEFKFPIPSSSAYANRAVGLYTSSRFLNDPQGRHDTYVEVWTAPCNIGEGKVINGWRDEQVCLAVSTQMALTVPMEVNHERGKKSMAKL